MSSSYPKNQKIIFSSENNPIVICSKCLGDHLKKYCDIYHMYSNDNELYLYMIKDFDEFEDYRNSIMNTESYKNILIELKSISSQKAIFFIMDNLEFHEEILKPIWKIIHERFSKEEIKYYIDLYNSYNN